MGCTSSRDDSSSCSAGVLIPRALKVKRLRFQETVEVFYFDRCPQFDRPAMNELLIPMGMRRRCFLHRQEPLVTEDRDTRGKVRPISPEDIDGMLFPTATTSIPGQGCDIKRPLPTSRRKGWRTWFGSSSGKKAFSEAIEELLTEISLGSSSLVSRN